MIKLLEKGSMVFEMKKACKNCLAATVKKYERDAQRLYELNNEGALPRDKSKWLKSDALFKKYKALPLNKRRAMSVAGVKASQAYGVKDHPRWDKALRDDVLAYKKTRSKHKLTDAEKSKIPVGGFEALKKISTEYKRNIKNDIKRKDLAGLYSYSKYIVVRFYSEYAFRNDLATIQIGEGENKLSKTKGIYEIEMKNFKSSDKIGKVTVKLSKALSSVFTKYIKYRAQFDLTHSYLLVNRSGARLSKKGLGNILNQITKKYLGTGFGTRIIRILKARSETKILDAAKKVANDMLHSLAQNQDYNKK